MTHPLTYPVRLDRGEEGDVVITFPDLPEANTYGATEAEAMASAPDCLRVALAGRVRDGQPIPDPSPAQAGTPTVSAPAEIAAKIIVREALARAGVSGAELARRLHVDEAEVRRILDPRHRTKLDRLEQAARALGGRFRVEWQPL